MPDPIRGVNPTQGPGVASTGPAATAPAPGGSTQSAAPVPVDSADVARAEALLATISSAAADVPAIDQSRVAELRNAILSGTYQINPQQIAQKLIDIERLLVPTGSE
jgi:negative regulator of flagellin synthesis FlgM